MLRPLNHVLKSAAIAAFFICLNAHGQWQANPSTQMDTESLDRLFAGYSACALTLTQDRHHQERLEYGPGQCQKPLSPCSTYKIPHALIGLQTGTVSGPETLKTWDGTQRSITSHNRDHTLASAMRHSVVWYFQAMAMEIGEAESQYWLETLGYGNQDLSGGLDRYWLQSSLQISAVQQMDFIRQLDHGTLPFKPAYQNQVHEMLKLDSSLPGQLYGKTGSCRGQPDHGWFIGWVDWASAANNPATTWFVVNISGPEAWGTKARKITLQLLDKINPVNGDTNGTP